MDPLTTSLLDLLYELREHNIPLIIGGGFGLFLKRQHLTRHGERTLLDSIPEVRSTNDIDLFLRVEVVASLERAQAFRAALSRLGYVPVEGAEFYQWKRSVLIAEVAQEIKLDFLVGPIGEFKDRLRIKQFRVRPKGDVKWHAHRTEEAIEIENDPIPVELKGRLSGGEPYMTTAFVPQAFPYLMMKLHAFDDRKSDARKDVGRHHALDLYTVVALMTESEYENSVKLSRFHGKSSALVRARNIVADLFSGPAALGILRLREHPLFRADFNLTEFTNVLAEIFDRRDQS